MLSNTCFSGPPVWVFGRQNALEAWLATQKERPFGGGSTREVSKILENSRTLTPKSFYYFICGTKETIVFEQEYIFTDY